MSCWCFIFLSLMAFSEINAKGIFFKNRTMKSILDESRSSNTISIKDILNQLYEETILRFQIEKKVHALAEKIADLEKGKETSVQHTSQGHGFYAYVSKDLANPGGGHTVIYDTVVTNNENGYNGHTGVFTVPMDGLYSFTWVTRVECSNHYTSELHVNNKVAGSVYIYCGYNSAAGNAIVDLRKDDVVFVRTLAGSGKIRSNEYGRTSFSGFFVG